jgi:hypothetical protein
MFGTPWSFGPRGLPPWYGEPHNLLGAVASLTGPPQLQLPICRCNLRPRPVAPKIEHLSRSYIGTWLDTRQDTGVHWVLGHIPVYFRHVPLQTSYGKELRPRRPRSLSILLPCDFLRPHYLQKVDGPQHTVTPRNGGVKGE